LKIRCLHGFFIFEESTAGEISRFMSLFNLNIQAEKNYFTFESLLDAPTYSIAGGTYLGADAIKTFEGSPWEVMRENNLVYDFTKDEVVPLTTITQRVQIQRAANYFLSSGLILPGSLNDGGSRVKDYAAWYLFDSAKFKYSEVSYE
jgi:hypothetical protein